MPIDQNISDMIGHAYGDNPAGMRDAMFAALQNKVTAALDQRKVDVAASLVTGTQAAEAELDGANIENDIVVTAEEDYTPEGTVIEEESLTKGMKLISKHGDGEHTAKVYHDKDWGEYQAHFYKGGKHMGEGPVHHTDDKADAQSTAEHEVKRMNSKA